MSSEIPHAHEQSQIAALVAGVVSLLVIATSAVVTASALATENPTSKCRAEEVTLTVAVEAFIASTDRAPDSQAELVDAGFIRTQSSLFDIHGATVAPAPGSPCHATLPIGAFAANEQSTAPEFTSPASVAPSITTTCSRVELAFARLDDVRGADPTQLSTELHSIAQSVRDARKSTQDVGLQSDIDAFANLISGFAASVGVLEGASLDANADADTTLAISALTEAIAGYLSVIHTSEIMSTLLPNLAATCGTGFVAAPTLVAAINALRDSLGDFLATDVGRRPEFSMLAAVYERMNALDDLDDPSSSLEDEFDECRSDHAASTLGDNDGCDALYLACGEGDMTACDDLFRASFPGSNYSTSGASCGGRTQPGGRGYAGYCEEITDP